MDHLMEIETACRFLFLDKKQVDVMFGYSVFQTYYHPPKRYLVVLYTYLILGNVIRVRTDVGWVSVTQPGPSLDVIPAQQTKNAISLGCELPTFHVFTVHTDQNLRILTL
jgi:hypothetical protein